LRYDFMFGINFKVAFEGIWRVLTTQRTFKVMLLMGVLVASSAFYLGFTQTEWMILVLVITMVLTTEMLNTSIEFLSDRVNGKHDEAIRAVKDVAAGASLTVSIVSIVIGVILFYPKILIFLN
jgi:undecaprenol kinase